MINLIITTLDSCRCFIRKVFRIPFIYKLIILACMFVAYLFYSDEYYMNWLRTSFQLHSISKSGEIWWIDYVNGKYIKYNREYNVWRGLVDLNNVQTSKDDLADVIVVDWCKMRDGNVVVEEVSRQRDPGAPVWSKNINVSAWSKELWDKWVTIRLDTEK